MLVITAYSLRGTPHGMNRDLAVTYNINAIIILGDQYEYVLIHCRLALCTSQLIRFR